MRGWGQGLTRNLLYHMDRLFPLGNLALSRALGDFCFKKNDKKSAEEQIVTGMNITKLNSPFPAVLMF